VTDAELALFLQRIPGDWSGSDGMIDIIETAGEWPSERDWTLTGHVVCSKRARLTLAFREGDGVYFAKFA